MSKTDSRGFFARALDANAADELGGFLRFLLAPAGAAYGLLMQARRSAYRSGLLTPGGPEAPVISVGNITAGGTGKTPMVVWLVRWLQAQGRAPAVLSRGYKADASGVGKNDEALLLELLLPNVPHYVDPDRVAAGRRALAAGADCLVLDDGFQHIRARRDVDLLLVDALNPFGGGRVLPAGLLREPLGCAREADAIILTRTDVVSAPRLTMVRDRIRRVAPGVPLVETVHRPASLIGPDGTIAGSADELAGRPTALFCGIGNPNGFLRTVEHLKARVVSSRFFPDHCPYDAQRLAEAADEAARAGAEVALTTEKDMVKIGEAWPGPIPLRALRVEMDVSVGLDRLERLLRNGLAQWD